MVIIKVVTYKEARLRYFQRRIDNLKRRLDWWTNPKRCDDYGWVQTENTLTDIGQQISFYEDAIKALGGGNNAIN